MWIFGFKGASGFSACSTAEQVAQGIDASELTVIVTGFYRSGDYSKSRQLADRCLEFEPDWSLALSLKKAIEEKVTKDGVIGIGIGIAATAVCVLAGGLATVLSVRKK